jgi:hypothetical protein
LFAPDGRFPADVESFVKAVDGRTTRHSGYVVGQGIRKRVEEIFGWTKTIACFGWRN